MSFQWSFGSKRADEVHGRRAPDDADDAPYGGELDAAIDTVARILRAMGARTCDVGDGESRSDTWERWAQHVLKLTPVPGASPDAQPPTRRQWGAIVRFFDRERARETERVSSASGDLRSVVWAFVKSWARVATADGHVDARLLAKLEKLKAAASSGPPEVLKRETLAAVEDLTTMVEERRKRQARELATLGTQLRAVGSELEEAKKDGARDPLTKLLNRRALDQCLERTVDVVNAFGATASLLLVDIDHFKAINDGYGHAAGDAVLRALADCLSRTFLRRGDVVARWGGEEFAVVLPETAVKHASLVAARLLGAVRSLSVVHGAESLRITVSVGVAPAMSGRTAEEWLAAADRALYTAKASGRNRIVVEGEPGIASHPTPTGSARTRVQR